MQAWEPEFHAQNLHWKQLAIVTCIVILEGYPVGEVETLESLGSRG